MREVQPRGREVAGSDSFSDFTSAPPQVSENAAMTDSRPALSISALALASGLDRRTVAARLDAADIAPVDTRAGHPVYALGDAFRALNGTPGELNPREKLAIERAAETRAAALLAEQALHHQLAGLIPLEAAQAEMHRMVDWMLAQLLRPIPARLAARGVPGDAVARVRQMVGEIEVDITRKAAQAFVRADE